MNQETLVLAVVLASGLPCALFLLNLLAYRPPPGREDCVSPPPIDSAGLQQQHGQDGVSVLIPARNEEANIETTLRSVLLNRECRFEVIVLDDSSIDRTAEIVSEMARQDPRLRLEAAPALPAGWCGKQYACQVLAGLARYPVLVFLDADVRLAPDALSRMQAFLESSGAALASGIPRQDMGTFTERLLLPLIHFVLLGYLPMHAMRCTLWPAMSAGCGQLFIARRDAYLQSGGHAGLKDSLHDGLLLPRIFRRAGFATDLFDATGIARCRMYRTNGETWRGLGKNATEGLAAPRTIGPMTTLLVAGQVMPFVLLACGGVLSASAFNWTMAAVAFALLPRIISVPIFKQPWWSALLHPVGIVALLVIQWNALIRRWLGKPCEWRGRSYHPNARVADAKAL